ncbi:MAG: tRNA threonylcarbamoyladenosine dehydratase [Lachnospiraceae bacterium]|nr:tRNA threonylcarbamoyladenosine dehydratase [Lachnospiraceae bacterium]
MLNQFSRTQLLLGPDTMESLYSKKVAVFGIGGVGGYVCEALVRSGIGAFDLIDDDKVCLTNLNRQIIATRKTVGKYKAEVMRDRMLEINPDAKIEIHKCFFLPENADDFPFSEYDYIVDAVDTVTAKIELVMRAQKEGVPIISAMGAGNKMDAGKLKIADIYDTKICPLARVMRRELKKRNVKKLKVVYSDEQPIRPLEDMSISCRTHCICPPGAQHKCTERRDIPGSTAFVPAVAGLLIAGEIVKDLCGDEKAGMIYESIKVILVQIVLHGENTITHTIIMKIVDKF